MKCPCCGKEMERGVVQSARQIYFTTKPHKNWFAPNLECGSEILLSSQNWTSPTCVALHCPVCKKVVIDYSAKAEE